VLRPGGYLAVFGHPATLDLLTVSMRLGGLAVVDQLVWLHGQGWARPHTRSLDVDEDVAAALKPAARPILLARAPLDGTVAQTFALHATGLLRLEQTRASGRRPANALLSHEPDCNNDTCDPGCPVAMLDAQSGRLKARGNVNPSRSGGGSGASGPSKSVLADHGGGDWGGASRFFFCARASTSERNTGLAAGQTNPHPSVKPVAVMRWLSELMCPPGGIVLDPFIGSGTTAVAAAEAGMDCVGNDRDEDGLYLPVAAARARHAGAEVRLHDPSTRRGIEPGAASEVTEDLRQAARQLRKAEQRVAVLRGERDVLLARARAEGLTWRRIAELCGLSSPQAAERIFRSVGEPDG
jgi:site-specific DNA-methyltransferase (adenine-specific)